MGLVDYASDSGASSADEPTAPAKKVIKIAVDLPRNKHLRGDESGSELEHGKRRTPLPAAKGGLSAMLPPPRSGGSGASVGLGSLLPPPRNIPGGGKHEGSMVPPAVSKRTSKSGSGGPSTSVTDSNAGTSSSNAGMSGLPAEQAPKPQQTPPRSPSPDIDFFGLSSGPSSTPLSPAQRLPQRKFKMSAPIVEDKHKKVVIDGMTQLPSGEWVPADAEAYAKYLALQQQEKRDKEFEQSEISSHGGLVDVNSYKPEVIEPPRVDETPGPGPLKNAPTARAKYKHQLTALISEAHTNRGELEAKLAQARANRKSAGAKYGESESLSSTAVVFISALFVSVILWLFL